MALSSPGVEVKVIDESFYTPAEPGTVPLIIVATAENKSNGGGTGTAPGTLAANAGEVYLLTSQKDLADNFGDPIFKTDASGNPVHAGEQNEYGLQAAYSLLGVSNRAYVVRADVDLAELDASATEPNSNPANGTHWLDTSISAFGIFEWNGASATTSSGQKFTNKVPLVITDSTRVDPLTGGPKTSVGAVGDYAIVSVDTDSDTPALTTLHGDILGARQSDNTVWYRSRGVAPGQTTGQWVQVGQSDWFKSQPTVASSKSNPTITSGQTLIVNGSSFTGNASLAALVTAINATPPTGVSAAAVNGKLELYFDTTALGLSGETSTTSNGINLGGTAALLTELNLLSTTTYFAPALQISKHTVVPQWKSSAVAPRPTGSVWIKTTEANLGARFRVKRWNGTTLAWETVSAPLYPNNHSALYELDVTGGGTNLPVGQLYVQTNHSEDVGFDGTPKLANYRIWRRGAVGATTITSEIITTQVTAGSKSFIIAESLLASPTLGDYNLNGTYSSKTITFTAAGAAGDADTIAGAINAAGFTNIVAEVDSKNRIVISHLLGGDFRVKNGTGTPFTAMGFSAYDYEPSSGTFGSGTRFVSTAPAGDADSSFVVSNWEPLVYAASADAPARIPEEGQLWYSSVIDEIDIMIHDGSDFVGYKTATSPYFANGTDPAGPIVSATAPENGDRSDSGNLVTGDLWIDTSDLENFPQIYRFNAALASLPVSKRWVLVDKTDQTTEDGVLFADARYNTAGANSYEAGAIEDLLTSNYVDPDAPDPALYPQGMLLWNLRRSGYNVKSFRRDYINIAEDNPRYDPTNTGGEAMAAYYTHRWVTVSSNQDDGSGSFGRKAQRKVVVTALQAAVNSNDAMRDDERRVFNLIACPGYPELIGEMITLNYDRGLTAFVVGDTPARLTPDATSLLKWGSNELLANEDNDIGATSFDEYMGMFYPWGFSSDNFGNNVVVPPSHMILRTIALSDQVSYPWFAPAGVRRGGITNATAVGYITAEGEFSSVALNGGQRDTLYEQKINPITFLTGTGLVNYGQKTRARAASSLDRINVARLVIYMRRQLNALAKPYIFEPNDKITRDEIKGAVESLLLELVGQRALYDYIVVCDESNNTPSRIDRNELWIDIAIEPVKAVEFIYIPLRLKNTGEIAGL
jgi:hypothetical protein